MHHETLFLYYGIYCIYSIAGAEDVSIAMNNACLRIIFASGCIHLNIAWLAGIYIEPTLFINPRRVVCCFDKHKHMFRFFNKFLTLWYTRMSWYPHSLKTSTRLSYSHGLEQVWPKYSGFSSKNVNDWIWNFVTEDSDPFILHPWFQPGLSGILNSNDQELSDVRSLPLKLPNWCYLVASVRLWNKQLKSTKYVEDFAWLSSFIWLQASQTTCDVFINIHQCSLTRARTITWLPHCQWRNPDDGGNIYSPDEILYAAIQGW